MDEAYIRRHVRHPGNFLGCIGIAYAALFVFEAPVRSMILAVLLVLALSVCLVLSVVFYWWPAIRELYRTASAASRRP